jgi:hypothetical protein
LLPHQRERWERNEEQQCEKGDISSKIARHTQGLLEWIIA